MNTLGWSAAALTLSRCRSRPFNPWEQPNILFIMTDDHAAQALSCYGSRINHTPNLDRISREGMRFENCFCTNSICAPSRAVILTGKYSHINGVRDNRTEFDRGQMTFPKILREAGYQTAVIGKWHLRTAPSGFDYWSVLPGQGHYYNPDMIEMGKENRHFGYVTDILTDKALDWLENGRDNTRPFMMMLHHKAPHRNWQPAIRHLNAYSRAEFPEPPTLFDDYDTRSDAAREQEMTIKDHMILDYDLKMGEAPARMTPEQKEVWNSAYAPEKAWFKENRPQGRDLVRWKYRRYLEDYLGCINAVDESTGRVLKYLENSGLADNTLMVYSSDQGFYLGEHGWFDKRFIYEESLRMPLLARFPGKIAPGSVNTELVGNLDFAPTLLEAGGAEIPEGIQGRSLIRLMQGKQEPDWRQVHYYHYYEYPGAHRVKRHFGVRTRRYKLVRFYYDIEAWEFYDLEKDPLEVRNVYDDPGYSAIILKLKRELNRLQKKYGDSEELAREFVEADLEKLDKG